MAEALRRDILKGMGAVTALAVPAAAGAAAGDSDGLAWVIDAWRENHSGHLLAIKTLSAIEKRPDRPAPAAVTISEIGGEPRDYAQCFEMLHRSFTSLGDLLGWYRDLILSERRHAAWLWRTETPPHFDAWLHRIDAQRSADMLLWNERHREWERWHEAAGYFAAEEAIDHFLEAMAEAERTICDWPVATRRELALKVEFMTRDLGEAANLDQVFAALVSMRGFAESEAA